MYITNLHIYFFWFFGFYNDNFFKITCLIVVLSSSQITCGSLRILTLYTHTHTHTTYYIYIYTQPITSLQSKSELF
ncbi:hypothetical protein Hanom_Chr02g00175111 [Helianthus anomalus]